MPQENVQAVLESIEAFNRSDVDAFVGTVSLDVDWEDAMFWSEPLRVYRGRGEVREWFHRVLEPFESIHVEPDEIREASDGRVLARGVMTARGMESGAETRLRGWLLYWVANGTITKRRAFIDRDEALEAAGLSK